MLQQQPSKSPTDADNVAALNSIADQLTKIAANATGPGADAAKRLSADAVKLAQADEVTRNKAQMAFVMPLQVDVAQLNGPPRC